MSYAYNYHEFLYASRSAANAENVKERVKYADLLNSIRGLITREHPDLIRDVFSSAEGQKKMRAMITKYVHSRRAVVEDEGMSKMNAIIDKLFDDMFGFGILTPYIYDENVQEINANRWDDIEIVTADGYRKLSERFTNPMQAQDIARRMAQLGGVTVDMSTPTGDSYITEGVRIHAKIPPIIDEKAGVQFSIRKQRRAMYTTKELIDLNTASADELELLSLCLAHGVSIGIAGNTGSGKTTDISYLLSMMPPHLRIYTIEDTRETQLERQEGDGYISRVMHTKTRYHSNPQFNVDARQLVRDALRCDPDIIVPSEMRGAEALDVMEAGRTGHTIISSFHAQDAEDAYLRIASMAMMAKAGYTEAMLLKFAYASFPIMIHKMRLSDGSRKYLEIVEAQHMPNDEYKIVPLFRFEPEGQDKDGITGTHERLNSISERLAYRLRIGGAPDAILKKYEGS